MTLSRPILSGTLLLAFTCLCGCSENQPETADRAVLTSAHPDSQNAGVSAQQADPVVATVSGRPITMQQLQKPLVEAYGLNMLLKLVELDLAKQEAARNGIQMSPQDVAAETQRYLDSVFQDDKKLADMRDELDTDVQANKTAAADKMRADIKAEQQRLLNQLLDQQHISRAEFDIAMQTNAYLRRIVQPSIQSKLTDENLQARFRTRYGEKVQVRHIELANLQEVRTAQQRLAAGEPFAKVAQEMSRNQQTRMVGGEVPAFSRSTPGIPQAFKDVAFSLDKPNAISEPVQAEGSYHLIQLIDRIPPEAVKFEDVKEAVRQELAETLTDAAVKQLRAQLGQQALRELQIDDPVLKEQFDAKLSQRDQEVRGRDAIRRELRSERSANTAPAATITEPADAAPSATMPATSMSPATTKP